MRDAKRKRPAFAEAGRSHDFRQFQAGTYQTGENRTSHTAFASASDLMQEAFASVRNVRQAHLDYLRALGVSPGALACLGQVQPPFGVLGVQELEGSLFEPSPVGRPALIVPVAKPITRDIQGLSIDDIAIVDLIAVRSAEPTRWLWRDGSAWALGSGLLGQNAPLRVVPTPFDWLKAGGQALCILDWAAPAHCWELLRGELALELPDGQLRNRLRNALVRNAALPPMEVAPRAA
ncbi:hypothetical protein [Novosphingobium sp.]|uniref:hypothetical protein n=1 Tax=Novosphingobium sp. TaxID=1874826 RepID=UPI002FDE1B45